MSHLQQPSGCDYCLDGCAIPGFTALPRSDVKLFASIRFDVLNYLRHTGKKG